MKHKMKGKHIIFNSFAVAALLLAAGCANLETDSGVSGVPMSFRSYTPHAVNRPCADANAFNPVTRAAADPGAMTETTLPANTSFGVFAYKQDGDVSNGTVAHWTDGGWNSAFMFNQRVDFDGTDYDYTPIQYWPSNEENTISFWAYWPYELYAAGNTGALKFYETGALTSAYTSSSTTGLPVAKYTVSTDPAQQYDLLFDSFDNTDRTYANGSGAEGEVPLNFRHALALVEFEIIEGTGAVIDAMSVSNLYWSGVCTDVQNRTWTSQGDRANFSVSDITVNSSTICSLIMIPQTIDANAELTISYDITFESSDPGHPEPIVYRGNSGSALLRSATTADGSASAGITAWQAGQHYIYKIRAGFERIEFEEVVLAGDDWSVGNSNISVPE